MKKIILTLFILFPFVLPAQIMFTDITPDYFQNSTGDKSFDFDADGTTDMELGLVILVPNYDVWFSSKTFDSFAVAIDTAMYGFVKKIEPGAPIGPGNVWKAGTNIPVAYLTSGAVEGPWPGSSDKYIGIRLKKSGGYKYGWMRISVHNKVSNYTLKEYAYQQSAGVAINAGDKGVTGLQHTAEKLQPVIYKNGTTLHVTHAETGATAELYDLSGRLIHSATEANGKILFSVCEEMKGLHIVLMKTGEGSRAYKAWL